MLHSLGLLVDGPAAWGRPVNSRVPGIFVVELPGGLRDAPIDIVAVRRWIEHVPLLALDGARPAPPDVAQRLHEFWLPDEPVMYIGRSPRQIGARINSMYATELGDTRPHSGGHWLKTLSVLPDLRIWWAETDAHEEYEDALLAEIAARNAYLGRDATVGALLPFANLMATDGVPKAHGLVNSLRADTAETPGTAKPAAKTKRQTKAGAQPSTKARRTPTPKAAPVRPVAEPTFVSREGLERLKAELEDLRTVQRPQIIARVAAARELGDLRENAEYEYSRKEQSFIEGRIQTLEQMLRTNVLIERNEALDTVHLGSTVDVESDGEQVTYVIVGSTEASPGLGRLSNNSPVGRALIGAHAGDDVRIELPSGPVTYRVISIR